jgi:hypothetical protein
MIYALEILDLRFIKIGYTSADVATRIASLQTGSPFLISSLFVVEGTLLQEQAIHGSLKKAMGRIRINIPPNEWYPGRHPFITQFLSKLKTLGPNQSLLHSDSYHSNVKQFGTSKPYCEGKPNYVWARQST